MGFTIHVNTADRPDVPAALLRDAVRLALETGGVETGEVSLTLQSDDEIQGLNREYLGRDRPTDVIAFALHDDGQPVLGDVYVGYDRAVAQARELGIALTEELARLAIHGTLHVLGHDHAEGAAREESEMFHIQESVLRTLLDATS